ncbi:intron-binding protein aquarius [Nannizzia gypsea CBS 118893]|uniref:Pre-mRNA-splicing factor n=1 Tax=Arthroderma gypseum (strain ATCC MYA-4604 / CBS 118893) TaxID=535722 RepID=E4V2S8_ARTGP|nr:intron-binding protein aquarius [Nannizzia gypsea CBS 118893]EFR04302.1 intron-binding protein aquarius [Nannizzia gypsea CBS 118893]
MTELQMRPAMARNPDVRPTVNDFQDENPWVSLAKAHWLKPSKVRKARPEVIKNEIWDPLQRDGFPLHSLLILENLHILEKFLWPTFTEDASNYHIMLIAVIVGTKRREHLPIWTHFFDRPADFSILFRRILSMSLNDTLPLPSKIHLLSFIIGAFQSLECSQIRKECAPLVSIAIWDNLFSKEARDNLLHQSGALKKAWRLASKRYDSADEQGKSRIRFERSWLYSMLLNFLRRINPAQGERNSEDNTRFCERFLELLVDLESQLPTRRYVNELLKDVNILAVLRKSKLYNDDKNTLFRDFYILLRRFINFSIDDQTGQHQSAQDAYNIHCQELARLQRTALKHFKDDLTLLALANYGSLEQRSELAEHLRSIDDTQLKQLCHLLGFRTSYPEHINIIPDRELLLEMLLLHFEWRPTFQEATADVSVLPTEDSLYDPALVRNETYDGSRPLAIPKLNLQYLSLGDFLWRSFLLYRSESFYEIKSDLESVIKRMQPKAGQDGKISFDGFSRMALPISKPAIIDVAEARVGSLHPAYVRSEITLEVGRLGDTIRQEWESLRPDDVVFLLSVTHQKTEQPGFVANPRSESKDSISISHVRTATVVQILDENRRQLRDTSQGRANGYPQRPRLRRLLVDLDAVSYKADLDKVKKGKPDIYSSINVLVRRKSRENNFRPILETMRSLTITDAELPSWLQEVFLGYGDPTGARYTELENRVKSVDYRDTFLDWHHLVESFPGQKIEPPEGSTTIFGPPYVLEMVDEPPKAETLNPSKKRRRDQAESVQPNSNSIRVSTYKPPNPGPYPMDAPKLNYVRFTPAQVEAITSGTQPGLTVIVGPPGTGKTDVITQIINNIYHNFPQERTLLIAHSNQALNQLFQKIVALDIDERHLLRLGHGEEELETESNFGKFGRVESFLENRVKFLAEVDRLAASIGAEGAHGSTCETAGYFDTVYIRPAWIKFWDKARSEGSKNEDIIQCFPFHNFFSNAPQPVFPTDASKDTLIDIAEGCERHIRKLFSELEDIRPFEILRQQRDKANYLLIKEARIIAMTSTHAAMRRQEISDLGFHYDSVVMEEAAQITEIESVIPCMMQKTRNGEFPLKRIVLCGDHLQNSPIVQNIAFRQYANFEQTLFLRLVRLGVPTISLDQQGRARASIAELFKWRYEKLGNLPIIESQEEFKLANAGFRYDYQLINVPDYQGQGEREPTPHFIQNLGEAEYAVGIYQYMRLLGYPASKISILATYAGQRALIRDVLSHRCAKNSLFGMPKIVTTVDKYQGEQNDYIILSLTRTKSVGYLRDVRRLTVALSRARLGLYILGRREVFESCFELKPAFDILAQRPDKLMLMPNETFPATRAVDAADNEGTPMENLEHLGQYVFEMTQAKVKALGVETTVTEAGDGNDVPAGESDDEDDTAREGAIE